MALLREQTHKADEVWVVDDGSANGPEEQAELVRRFSDLSLQYDWRPNDRCPARSRNRGVGLSRGQQLIFLDGDMLLNPNGLAAYRHFHQRLPNSALYAYMGCDFDAVCPSFLHPGRQVNARDVRFGWTSQGVQPATRVYHSPFECAFSGNFSLSRRLYDSVGGFDEGFINWGGEDLDFARRLIQAGHRVDFLLDAWAEHQEHSRQEDFHLQSQSHQRFDFAPHRAVDYEVQCLSTRQAQETFEEIVQHYYLKHEQCS